MVPRNTCLRIRARPSFHQIRSQLEITAFYEIPDPKSFFPHQKDRRSQCIRHVQRRCQEHREGHLGLCRSSLYQRIWWTGAASQQAIGLVYALAFYSARKGSHSCIGGDSGICCTRGHTGEPLGVSRNVPHHHRYGCRGVSYASI